MRLLAMIALVTSAVLAAHGFAQGPEDTRKYWVYEGGWFAQGKGDAWYELNEETHRRLGRPSHFREVMRTREYVQFYDAGRKVAIRLTETVAEVRWDADGKDAPWKVLYQGRWKKPNP